MVARFPLPGHSSGRFTARGIPYPAALGIQLIFSEVSIALIYDEVCPAPCRWISVPRAIHRFPATAWGKLGTHVRIVRPLAGRPAAIAYESRQLSANRFAVHPPIAKLPLVTLYVTERCNSRCVTCDYWRHGRDDMDLAAVTSLLPSLAQLSTQTVLLSGGEPLLNPDWEAIAQTLRGNGLKVWL